MLTAKHFYDGNHVNTLYPVILDYLIVAQTLALLEVGLGVASGVLLWVMLAAL